MAVMWRNKCYIKRNGILPHVWKAGTIWLPVSIILLMFINISRRSRNRWTKPYTSETESKRNDNIPHNYTRLCGCIVITPGIHSTVFSLNHLWYSTTYMLYCCHVCYACPCILCFFDVCYDVSIYDMLFPCMLCCFHICHAVSMSVILFPYIVCC